MIKKRLILPGLLVVFTACFIACNKKDVANLNFEVSANKNTYKVGDTVNFSISGNPELLTFYSGEKGAQYENRDRIFADGEPQLQFTSFQQFGTQANSLSLLVSSNFTGVYTAASIASATWTDITSRAILSTTLDNTASGVIDLSDFKSDKPIFFAFRFTGSTASVQRTWTIKNLVINNVLLDGNQVAVATIANAGWESINLNNSPKSWAITASQLQFQGGAGIGNNLGWVISKPLYLTKVTPDRGIALKNMKSRLDSYQYIYKTSGTYIPVFIGSNANVYGSHTSVKQLNITIAP